MSSNQTIIIEEGIKNGIFSETEADLMMINGQDIPLHTYSGWVELGKAPRKGEHGIQTRLWKKTQKEDQEMYVLVKSFLFSEAQVEDINEEESE